MGFLPYVVLLFVEGRVNSGENWVWDLVFGLIGLVYWVFGSIFFYEKIKPISESGLETTG